MGLCLGLGVVVVSLGCGIGVEETASGIGIGVGNRVTSTAFGRIHLTSCTCTCCRVHEETPDRLRGPCTNGPLTWEVGGRTCSIRHDPLLLSLLLGRIGIARFARSLLLGRCGRVGIAGRVFLVGFLAEVETLRLPSRLLSHLDWCITSSRRGHPTAHWADGANIGIIQFHVAGVGRQGLHYLVVVVVVDAISVGQRGGQLIRLRRAVWWRGQSRCR